MTKLLRIPEVADRLGVSESSARRLIDGGHIASTDVNSVNGSRPRLRVSEQAIEEFVASRTTKRETRVPA